VVRPQIGRRAYVATRRPHALGYRFTAHEANPHPSKVQIDAWEELGYLKRKQITDFLAELRRPRRLVANTPANQQRIGDGQAVARRSQIVANTPANKQLIDDGTAESRRRPLVAHKPANKQLIDDGQAIARRPQIVANTPANKQLIDDGQAIPRRSQIVANTPANKQLIDDGTAIPRLPGLVAHKPANKQLIDDGQAVARRPQVNCQAAAARAARVPLVPDTRTLIEQEAAAAAMVGSLVEQMLPAIVPGIKWYAGIGAKERCVDEDGEPLPPGVGELSDWFSRPSSTIRYFADGNPLTKPQLASISGCITYFLARDEKGNVVADMNSKVVDCAEIAAQRELIETATPHTTLVKTIGAGTCANVKDGKVNPGGFCLYGWTFDPKKLTASQLASLRFVAVTPSTFVLPADWRAERFADLSGYLLATSFVPRLEHAAAAAAYPWQITLVRPSGKETFWRSIVNGPIHERQWGYLGEAEGFSTKYDYGPGGDVCAKLAHMRAVRAKLSAKRMLRRGQYHVLEGGKAMPGPTQNAAVGTAAVSVVSQLDSESETDSEDENETDSEDDGCLWDA
jgi:hypothetical protein